MLDGQEVHFSSSRSDIFDHSFPMKGTSHVLKVVAHAGPPLSATPGFRQYDFMVDGLTFYRFPKVFRLGLSPGDPRAASSPAGSGQLAQRGNTYSRPDQIPVETPTNPDEVGMVEGDCASFCFVVTGLTVLFPSFLVRALN
jgi:hypothetical protein